MKISLIFPDITKSFSFYENHMSIISPERRENIFRLKSDKDKIISLFTELLMRRKISEELGLSNNEIIFRRNHYGKPFLEGYDNYFFSVSHSENCIAFVSSDSQIGVDTEKISNPNARTAKRFFTDNENEFINNSKEPSVAFYDIWTRKEAYVKMLGTGLSTPFTSFDVTDTNPDFIFFTTHYQDYSVSVCRKNNKL